MLVFSRVAFRVLVFMRIMIPVSGLPYFNRVTDHRSPFARLKGIMEFKFPFYPGEE